MVASVQMQARMRIKVWSFGVEIRGPKSSSVSRFTCTCSTRQRVQLAQF